MAKKVTEQTRERKNHIELEINPGVVREGDQIVLSGKGWGDCPVKIEIDGKAVKPFRVAQGYLVSEGVQPEATGSFVVLVATLGIRPSKHKIVATSVHKIRKLSVTTTFEVLERPPLDVSGEDEEVAYWRALDFFNRRFGHIGFIPPGTRDTQIGQIRLLREKRDRVNQRALLRQLLNEDLDPSMPNPAVCNWNPVGSGPVVVGPGL